MGIVVKKKDVSTGWRPSNAPESLPVVEKAVSPTKPFRRSERGSGPGSSRKGTSELFGVRRIRASRGTDKGGERFLCEGEGGKTAGVVEKTMEACRKCNILGRREKVVIKAPGEEGAGGNPGCPANERPVRHRVEKARQSGWQEERFKRRKDKSIHRGSYWGKGRVNCVLHGSWEKGRPSWKVKSPKVGSQEKRS